MSIVTIGLTNRKSIVVETHQARENMIRTKNRIHSTLIELSLNFHIALLFILKPILQIFDRKSDETIFNTDQAIKSSIDSFNIF